MRKIYIFLTLGFLLFYSFVARGDTFKFRDSSDYAEYLDYEEECEDRCLNACEEGYNECVWGCELYYEDSLKCENICDDALIECKNVCE